MNKEVNERSDCEVIFPLSPGALDEQFVAFFLAY